MKQTLPVTLKGKAGRRSEGRVELESFNDQQRLIRALKLLGIFWGIAIVCVFIPILHFVLVPLFLIAGPIAFSLTYQHKSLVLGGGGDCPGCAKPFDIAQRADRWPLQDICSECGEPVTVEKK